jgi:Arc/MetJ-type ribon-helix-helix transcriptional regulator
MKTTSNDTVQRGLRLPATLDEWIEEQARERGFRSVQEFILYIIRDYKEQDSAEPVAA